MTTKYKHMFYSEDPRCWKCGKYRKFSGISGTDITKNKQYDYLDRSRIYENIHEEECVSDEVVLLQQGLSGLYRIKHPFGPWKECNEYTLEDIKG
jgi:hypothetical protein